ncbi:MAG TPA: type II secretion system secretin GspD [Candidatus Acidoferrales bacterium]|nr:type II secretion system secretin GspD [Candidatus Acidoferrales bacterium]
MHSEFQIRFVRLLLFGFFLSWLFLAPVSAAQEEPEAEEPESEEPPSVPQPPPRTQPPAGPRAPERRLLPPRAPRGDMISLNFNRADLVEVIHILAQHLRINYTIDPEVKGTVTIYSAEPIRQDDLFPIFHHILRINGAVAVKSGDIYRIAPIKDGKGVARPIGRNKEDGFALQVAPVRFFTVAEMKRLLTPFVTPGGEILDFPRGNFLVIVDLPSNIQRLMEIKELIDVNTFAGTRMELYQPKVASAEDLASEMTKIMQAYASSATQAEGFAAQFIPVTRINQLLVISHSDAAWTYVQRWLERIDTLGEGPGRKIFIYPVENGKATDLADVLSQALGLATAGRREPTKTLQDLHRGTTLTTPGAAGGLAPSRTQQPPLYGPSSGAPQAMGGAFAVAPAPSTPAPAPVTPPVTPPAQPRPTPPGAPKPEEQLRIVPDPATNSLIIYGTAQEFQNIRNILRDLDQIPRQVLLDAMVFEVTLTDDQSLGIEYEILSKINPTIFGQTFGAGGALRTGSLPAAAASGLTQFGSGVSGVIGSHDFKAFINALLSDSRVKVLSSPSILASDNRPARIQVGTEEPIPTGTVVSSEAISTSTTIQYRNTGRILTIIPQVNSQGLVHLQIKAEVSQRGSNVIVGRDSFPSFDTRDTETTAIVQDGETLVLGGIITDRKSRTRTGIPYLMDLPIFGRFFGRTSDEIDRTELIVLVTPRVIRNVQEARDVTREFKEKLSTVARELEREKKEEEKRKPPPPVTP